MKIRMRFTEHFKVGLSQPEVDFVDIDLNGDMPLFVDPFAISVRDDDWSISCREPSPAEGVVRLSAAQLATLLEGLPWHRLQPRAIPRPSTAW
jgi:hypothetical protein